MINNIFSIREGKNGCTSLGIMLGDSIPKNPIENIKIIPYGKQNIENIQVVNKKPAMIFSNAFYCVNLYRQRNNNYILKYKLTEIKE